MGYELETKIICDFLIIPDQKAQSDKCEIINYDVLDNFIWQNLSNKHLIAWIQRLNGICLQPPATELY